MLAAQIDENGVVLGMYLVESLEFMPNLVAGDGAGPGDRWDGEQFVKQVTTPSVITPIIPESVPMRSARRALYAAGLLTTVESAISSMPGSAGDLARIDWLTALTVRRDDPVVVTLIPALGKTEAEIDAMFIAAAAM